MDRDLQKQILDGEVELSDDDLRKIITRPIIAKLTHIMNMLVRAAADGRGKFNNRGVETGETDEEGKPIYGQEMIPVKDRIKLGLDLVDLLFKSMNPNAKPPGDSKKSAMEMLKEFGVSENPKHQ